jgi:molecular chaperone GrpE
MSKKKSQQTQPNEHDRMTELEANLKRIQADFINYRRRQEEERGELLNLAKSDVVLRWLPLIDNLDRGLGHLPSELTDNPWAKVVEQVARQAQEVLKSLGVEKIESLGQPFDHNLHEAIAFEDGTGEQEVVVEELQPGYMLGDKVIRHAMVRVGRK